MKHSTFIREWIEYTKFEIGISLNPFNFFQGKTKSKKSFFTFTFTFEVNMLTYNKIDE